MPRLFKSEWPVAACYITTLLFFLLGNAWLKDLSNPLWFSLMLGWLFAAILISAFAVVRHAEAVAERIGEPFGTLVLTLSMSGMEMMMIAAIMFSGPQETTLARDTMLAIVMIVLNGLAGLCLLLGGLRYREQTYNLYGANAFLAVLLPMSVLGLVLPTFTTTTPGPVLAPLQSIFLIVMSIALYAIFLTIQTVRHRDYFVKANAANDAHDHPHYATHSTLYHAGFLLAYVLPIVLLAKKIALPIDYGIETLHAPPALGGLLVAILILSPESLAAVKSALSNRIQRSINLALGTALTSICLTIPAVLIIGFLASKTIILGLDPVGILMLLLSLAVAMLTYALERTNILLGAVHLLLFLAYLMLIFQK